MCPSPSATRAGRWQRVTEAVLLVDVFPALLEVDALPLSEHSVDALGVARVTDGGPAGPNGALIGGGKSSSRRPVP